MTGRMRGLLVTGLGLVFVALGGAFTKRKVEDDAYFNRHLKASFSKLPERMAQAKKLNLPLEASEFEPTWGSGKDMWPLMQDLRVAMNKTKLWAPAANYPSSNFVYSVALDKLPTLEKSLNAIADCTMCRSITDIEKGALSENQSTTNARGIIRIFAAKADQEMSRAQWSKAAESLNMGDKIARAAATGPNRDGLLTWAGNQLSLHRKMMLHLSSGNLEPERRAMFKNFLMTASAAPDMLPAINLEYYSLYWAAEHFGSLSKDDLALITAFSPSEHLDPPRHHAAPDAMASEVLDGWIYAVGSYRSHSGDPALAGRGVDEPFLIAVGREGESDFILETLDPVFEQTGMMIGRALETRMLCLAVLETLAAELEGRPSPSLASIVPPQGDYHGRRLLKVKTEDGWVIYLEGTKEPAALPYGLSDQLPANILAFRWKTKPSA